MIINYNKSRSSVYPELIDNHSSKKITYLRKNVVEKEETDSTTGEAHTYYEYDEAKLTKKEYQEYLNELSILDIEQQRADIDYIALMLDIDLEG